MIIFVTMKSLIKQVLNTIFLKPDIHEIQTPEQDLISLRPVLPGVNLPTEHLPYFLISLAVSGLWSVFEWELVTDNDRTFKEESQTIELIAESPPQIATFIHEYGHAIAAHLLDVHVYQTGLSLYFLMPVAFVQINSDQLEKLPVRRRIMVAAAGIFNNYILTLVCFLLLIINPYLLSAFYYSNQGVYVYNVNPVSVESTLLTFACPCDHHIVMSMNS